MVWQQPHVKMRWIDEREVRSIEPRLSHNIIGAVYEDESAQLDSYRLNLALARGAELKGVSILYREVPGLVANGSAISGVKTASGDISLWGGGGGRRHLEPGFHFVVGFPVPVRPMKGSASCSTTPASPFRR